MSIQRYHTFSFIMYSPARANGGYGNGNGNWITGLQI